MSKGVVKITEMISLRFNLRSSSSFSASKSISSDISAAPKPMRSIRSIISARVSLSASKSTVAFSVVKLTVA